MKLVYLIKKLCCFSFHYRSPVTHRMAPWVTKFFMKQLPRILCIERPKKDNPPEDDIGPPEVLTDVFHCPPDVDKFTHDYNTTDYGLPGEKPFNRKKTIQ